MVTDQNQQSLPAAKAPTGIEGFDEITGGGLPRGRTTLVVGSPGAGKTVFGLQTLVNGARQFGEPGIFVAFEERSPQVVANAASFGWDLPALERERLFFLDARPTADVITAGQFDLTGLLAGLEVKVQEMEARRVVFDSVDVLLSLLEDPPAERREIYRIHDWLARTGMTGLVSVRFAGEDPLLSPAYGFVQFMADCVVLLSHRTRDRVSLRALRVIKYRGSGFAEDEAPLLIGPHGLEVASLGTSEIDYAVSGERVSTGIPRLDQMLRGGYYRGSSVLVTGAPGTAKSTLAGAFVEAACRRGERALLVSFDQASGEIVRDLASVSIDLASHISAGLLRLYGARTEAGSAEAHLMTLRRLIEEHEPSCVVVDPLSAMIKAGGFIPALSVAQRLIHLAKTRSITLLCTSLLEGESHQEGTPLQVSTVADAWIQLSYLARGGERNRALSVIKSRGTGHSDQVRELILSDEGVTLADVYTAGGEVLMGTLRWEREAEVEAERERIRAQVEHRRRELELAEAEAEMRMEIIQRELQARRAELAMLQVEEELREEVWRERLTGLQTRRSLEDDTAAMEPADSQEGED
jgi:circadian clock protein KaiC